MDASFVEPVVEPVYGLEPTSGPLGPGVRAFVQYTTGAEPPEDINRPAEANGAHATGYGWDGMLAQTVHFLSPETEGEVEHFCGTEVCSPANQGSYPE